MGKAAKRIATGIATGGMSELGRATGMNVMDPLGIMGPGVAEMQGLGPKKQGGDGPKGLPAGGPVGPKPELTSQQLLERRSSVSSDLNAPSFLSLSPQMNDLQRRTAIATGATSGDGENYTDPESVKYYNNVGLRSIGDYNQIAPVELEYLKRLGQSPKSNTMEGFFSALDRALGG